MGWAERMAGQAVEASKKPGAPEAKSPEVLAARPPSDWLEAAARQAIAECIHHSNALMTALQPRSALVGPDGKSAAAPQINVAGETLLMLARLERSQAVVMDPLVTFLTGRAELRPNRPPGNVSE